MRKIVRLTESDLIRLVKRVINEQTTPSTGIGKSAAKQFVEALSQRIDDNNMALKAMQRIKNKTDFNEFAIEIKRITRMDFCDYLKDEMTALEDNFRPISDIAYNIGGISCGKGNYSELKYYMNQSGNKGSATIPD